MEKDLKKIIKTPNGIASAILYIIVGVLFCIFKGSVLSWILTVAGILFIAMGIFDMVEKKAVTSEGIVDIIIGVVIIVCGWLIVSVVLVIFGVLVAIKGAVDLVNALKPVNIVSIVFACVTLALGILLIVSNWVVTDLLFIIIGVIFIVNGVIALLGQLKN